MLSWAISNSTNCEKHKKKAVHFPNNLYSARSSCTRAISENLVQALSQLPFDTFV